MKSLLTTLLILSTTLAFSQSDTTFFNADWKKCSKAEAKYYRLKETNGNRYVLKDMFLKTNTPQMIEEGYMEDDKFVKDGKYCIYFDSGKKDKEGLYKKDEKIGVWTIWDKQEKDSLVVDCAADGTYKNIFVPAYKKHNTELGKVYKMEVMPEFEGGEQAMMDFVGTNIKYPNSERLKDISGTCYVTFVVEADGRVTNTKILRGVAGGPLCDLEAMRVVNSMPNWTPGTQFGENVRVQFNLPIKFTLRRR